MVVDDCEVTLAATAETLDRAGYRVITRERPAGCVAMMLQEKPDLVLLDVCMPTVSGDTLVKLFSKAAPDSGTIILLYSALDEPLLRSKAKAAGAHGYVLKTGDSAALLRGVRRWLRPSMAGRISLPRERISEGRNTHQNGPASRMSSPVVRAQQVSSQDMPVAQVVSAQSSATRRRMDTPKDSRFIDLDLHTTVSGEMRRTSGSYSIGAPTVLFVDDDMLILSGYRRQLHGQPFEFDFALSGAQALRHVTAAAPPSVIVMDLLMPEPDGAEVLRRALDVDISWSRRFVIVTAQPLGDAKKQLDRRFFGTLLQKPIKTNDLVAAIRGSLASAGVPVASESPVTAGR